MKKTGLFLTFISIFCLALPLSAAKAAYATENMSSFDNLDIRPTVGYGWAASENGERGMGYHAGVRILTSVRSLSTSEPNKRSGIELSVVSPFESRPSHNDKKYIAAGFILEQILWTDIVITIGTIGYIGIDGNRNKPFGLMADLAWEPHWRNFQPFIGLRSEAIYDTATITRYSLSGGMKFNIF